MTVFQNKERPNDDLKIILSSTVPEDQIVDSKPQTEPVSKKLPPLMP